jgi:hypothetical protein
MLLLTKPLICQSRNRPGGAPGRESGYGLVVVMLAATLVLIGLMAVLSSISMEGQREREAELVFRGTQYSRAIVRYHQQFQRFPVSISDLTQLTNGIRFLRKEYTDPMMPNGKWRFIHVNGQGVLLDSKNTVIPGAGGQGQQGSGQSTGGFGSSDQTNGGGDVTGASGGGFSLGSSGSGGALGSQQNTALQDTTLQGPSGGNGILGSLQNSTSQGPSASGGTLGSQGNSAFFSSNQGSGMYIAGVASRSHKTSIRIYNSKTHYDEWEFLAVDQSSLGLGTTGAGAVQGAASQSGQGSLLPK